MVCIVFMSRINIFEKGGVLKTTSFLLALLIGLSIPVSVYALKEKPQSKLEIYNQKLKETVESLEPLGKSYNISNAQEYINCLKNYELKTYPWYRFLANKNNQKIINEGTEPVLEDCKIDEFKKKIGQEKRILKEKYNSALESLPEIENDFLVVANYFLITNSFGEDRKELFKDEFKLSAEIEKLFKGVGKKAEPKEGLQKYDELITKIEKLKKLKRESEIKRKTILLGSEELAKKIPNAPTKQCSSMLVNLSSQTLYVFKEGNLIADTPITSGKSSTPTTPGSHFIISTNLPGFAYEKEKASGVGLDKNGYKRFPYGNGNSAINWSIASEYAFRITPDGIMIHDSNSNKGIGWRFEFGTKGGGSNGCVNTPIVFIEKVIIPLIEECFDEKNNTGDNQIKVVIY